MIDVNHKYIKRCLISGCLFASIYDCPPYWNGQSWFVNTEEQVECMSATIVMYMYMQ